MTQPFIHKKSLGQHFLNNEHVPRWMCEAGGVSKSDTVLEIGPGTGALTRALLATGAKVIALETDERALTVLEETFKEALAAGQLTLHHTDVRTLDLKSLGLQDHSFKVVANIPYYLSGHLFHALLQAPVQPSDLVFLVQKEVAKRACATPGGDETISLLSIATQVYGTVKYVRVVPKGHFTPPPKIDSAIISVTNITRSSFSETCTEEDFFMLLKLGFGQKRKQLQGNLRSTFKTEDVHAALAASGIGPNVRAETLTVQQWATLTSNLSPRLN